MAERKRIVGHTPLTAHAVISSEMVIRLDNGHTSVRAHEYNRTRFLRDPWSDQEIGSWDKSQYA